MFHSADEYETRAIEAERLAFATRDLVLREEMLSLARIYRDYADFLRGRPVHEDDADWRKAVNG
jgi:hypothetical protein